MGKQCGNRKTSTGRPQLGAYYWGYWGFETLSKVELRTSIYLSARLSTKPLKSAEVSANDQ